MILSPSHMCPQSCILTFFNNQIFLLSDLVYNLYFEIHNLGFFTFLPFYLCLFVCSSIWSSACVAVTQFFPESVHQVDICTRRNALPIFICSFVCLSIHPPVGYSAYLQCPSIRIGLKFYSNLFYMKLDYYEMIKVAQPYFRKKCPIMSGGPKKTLKWPKYVLFGVSGGVCKIIFHSFVLFLLEYESSKSLGKILIHLCILFLLEFESTSGSLTFLHLFQTNLVLELWSKYLYTSQNGFLKAQSHTKEIGFEV